MNEQKILRTQLFKYIKSNLLNLIIVFILFGLFMIFLVRRITLSSRAIKKNLRNSEVFEINQDKSSIDELQQYGILSSITNPKILCIIRDKDGKILSTNSSYLSNEAFKDFEFDNKYVDKSYIVKINDEYLYKCRTIDISDVTEFSTGYIQLLINIDFETEMMQSYDRIVIWSVIFGMGISVIASIIISVKLNFHLK